MQNTAASTDYYAAARNDILPYVPSAARTVLEIGCGFGHFGLALKQRQSCEVWGIEMVPKAAAEAETRLDKVFCGDAMSCWEQLPDQYFEVLVMNDVLEHMVDPYVFLRKIKTKLKPNATLIASIPNIRYIRTLFDLVVARDFRYTNDGVMDRTHLRFFTRMSMQRMFQDEGYRIEKMDGNHPSRHPLAWLLTLVSFGWMRDCLYMHYTVLARPD